MMHEIYSEIFKESIIDKHDPDKYIIDLNQVVAGTAIRCPFDTNIKVGRNEQGEVCIVKKSLFRPFRKK